MSKIIHAKSNVTIIIYKRHFQKNTVLFVKNITYIHYTTKNYRRYGEYYFIFPKFRELNLIIYNDSTIEEF